MTRDLQSLRSPRIFLKSEFVNEDADLSLISQVELWSITGKVFDRFGADIEGFSIVRDRVADLEEFAAAYNRWYQEWSGEVPLVIPVQGQTTNEHICLRPKASAFNHHIFFHLYFYSAKLYLFSHVFRGLQRDHQFMVSTDPSGRLTATTPRGDIHQFAEGAMKSAQSIVRAFVDDIQGVEYQQHEEPQGWLSKLPVYLGTTTAFASVFSFGVASGCAPQAFTVSNNAALQPAEVIRSLRRLSDLLLARGPGPMTGATHLHPDHPLLNVAKNLQNAIGDSSEPESDAVINTQFVGVDEEEIVPGRVEQPSLGLPPFQTDEAIGFSQSGQDGFLYDWMNFDELLDSGFTFFQNG